MEMGILGMGGNGSIAQGYLIDTTVDSGTKIDVLIRIASVLPKSMKSKVSIDQLRLMIGRASIKIL